MSRVAKAPVAIPTGVEITQNGQEIKVKGKVGELTLDVNSAVALTIADNAEIEPADKRIRVDTRKWIASRFNAKKYGDKQYIETKDTTDDVSDDELNDRIKALMDKK